MAGAALQAIEGGTLLTLRVVPGASRDALGEFDEWRGAFTVAVSAPAHSGRANVALLALLEHELELEPGSAELLRGHRSRSKQVAIPLERDALLARLEAR
ncbi:MAG: hypothetical protein CL960_01810 [Euryarchaeota archaeon]|jgi:uncharacterized protein (TIGR00251 family)|nr:hypothetical protein [Euryarchaeota archaeon]MDP6363797.1 DUF167 family protein [Candidatus Poseidoniia archaeon]MDP6658816.1 DUF167 family protein [Candidatus Poseidoniia archaeon]MDP6846711.1 DUF167 family protein [Candidatus Poseidoniia archaeon]MDP7006944.1 DUF167 family protein [Candidatus Poseidoniia archaeon]|tara:strand:- start:2760 stop:3059 length:300 start_codon:yes stop_codon:yes gene_type:complete